MPTDPLGSSVTPLLGTLGVLLLTRHQKRPWWQWLSLAVLVGIPLVLGYLPQQGS